MVFPAAVCLFGPTGSGKSALALELARDLPLEIVSVDSVMVYRYMDIGSAKPSIEERRQVPHHGIDLVDPCEPYSVGAFLEEARDACACIWAKGRLPLLVGGTMMYFWALAKGLSPLPQTSPETRQWLLLRLEEEGLLRLYEELGEKDPKAASSLHAGDTQRILRALEVWHEKKIPWSSYHALSSIPFLPPEKGLWLAIWPSARDELRPRLLARFLEMLEKGLEEEVAYLKNRFCLTSGDPPLRSVGYREMAEVLEGKLKREQLPAQALLANLALAKKQLTWMRRFTPFSEKLSFSDPHLLAKAKDRVEQAAALFCA